MISSVLYICFFKFNPKSFHFFFFFFFFFAVFHCHLYIHIIVPSVCEEINMCKGITKI